MDRRNFLKVGAAGLAVASTPFAALTSCSPSNKKTGVLNISFQEKTAPGNSLDEKFDYMEKLGVTGFEPHGNQLITRFNEFQQALKGRNIKVSAICAGFKGFILAEDPAVKAEFDSTMRELIAAAGVNRVIDNVVSDETYDKVIAAGAGVMYAHMVLGVPQTDLWRDYTHLSDYGRLLAAYSFYTQFTGNPVTQVGIDSIPAADRVRRAKDKGDLIITEEMEQVIIDATAHALEDPWFVPANPQ